MPEATSWTAIVVTLVSVAGLAGCRTVEELDDNTAGSPTPTCQPAQPELLELLPSNIDVSCTGTGAASSWRYYLETIGWAEDQPYVVVYDNPDWYDAGANDPSMWSEEFYMNWLEEGSDTCDGNYYSIWARDDLVNVLTFEEQEDNVSTLFACQTMGVLTYVFYAADYFDASYEVCAAVGKYPEVFAAACEYD